MTWTQAAYEAVVRVLGERTGLSFPPNRVGSVELGIDRAMKRAGISDPAKYFTALTTDAKVFDDLVVELTIGETYFFREPAQFEFIRRRVLPDILQRRGRDHVLRAWCAACASGEEAYSLAMLFQREGVAERTHVLATDISRDALAKSRRAVYGSWSLRGEAALPAQPFLVRQGERFVVDEKIRRRVTFEHLNLALDVYPSFATSTWGMDLIMCRNVLIYFDRQTIHQVANRLLASLAPGGWLITASSDPPLAEEAPFETVFTEVGLFYRHPEVPLPVVTAPAPAPPRQVVVPAPAIPLQAPAPAPARPRRGPEAAPALAPAPLVDRVEEAHKALAQGDYVRATELTRLLTADPQAAAIHVRALANLETAQAEQACAQATARHPLAVELQYLHAVLLMELERDEEAAQAARRVLYLDRSLAIAHFTLAAILRRSGDLPGARRAYRNVANLCAKRPADEVVPLSDGEHAGRLVEAARTELAVLQAAQEVSS